MAGWKDFTGGWGRRRGRHAEAAQYRPLACQQPPSWACMCADVRADGPWPARYWKRCAAGRRAARGLRPGLSVASTRLPSCLRPLQTRTATAATPWAAWAPPATTAEGSRAWPGASTCELRAAREPGHGLRARGLASRDAPLSASPAWAEPATLCRCCSSHAPALPSAPACPTHSYSCKVESHDGALYDSSILECYALCASKVGGSAGWVGGQALARGRAAGRMGACADARPAPPAAGRAGRRPALPCTAPCSRTCAWCLPPTAAPPSARWARALSWHGDVRCAPAGGRPAGLPACWRARRRCRTYGPCRVAARPATSPPPAHPQHTHPAGGARDLSAGPHRLPPAHRLLAHPQPRPHPPTPLPRPRPSTKPSPPWAPQTSWWWLLPATTART